MGTPNPQQYQSEHPRRDPARPECLSCGAEASVKPGEFLIQVQRTQHVAGKARESRDMSQYLLHILSLSSLIKAGRYFNYIHNRSCSQMLKLSKKKF